MAANRPLLVTGTIRSGTTWAGRMIAAHPEVAYINEPLNRELTPATWGQFPVDNPFWYTYISEKNEGRYLEAYRNLVSFRFDIRAALRELNGAVRTAPYTPDELNLIETWARFASAHLHRRRPLLKDPFALISTPWFADRLGAVPVVLIRHPAAFVSSLLRLDWNAGMDEFLQQPELLAAHPLPDHERELAERFLRDEDKLGLAALGWSYQHRIVRRFREEHPGWVHVRHEDLSRDPDGGYRDIFRRIGLDYTPEVRRAVRESSKSGNPRELKKHAPHSVKLDSRANVKNWKHRLTEEQTARIRELVEDVSKDFYGDGDW